MEREYYVTKEKKKELQEELDFLKNTKRREIAKDLEYAKSLGDLSENAEYHEARQNQAELEARIREIEDILKHATIVAHRKSDTVEIGSTVEIRKPRAHSGRVVTVVGSQESDLSTGKISFTSPLGQSLMGKKKGDRVDVETPGGVVTYTVESVE